MNKIKLLNFAVYYAPHNTVATFRNLKLSKYLDEHDFEQYVFTGDFPDNINLDLDKDLPRSAKIFRKKAHFPEIKAFAGFNAKPTLISRLKYLVKDLFFSPDKYIYWTMFYLPQMIKMIKKEKIKLVMISGHPGSAFIAGYWLKKICDVKLILDFHDPWKSLEVSKKQSFIRRAAYSFWEAKCVKNADLITTAHESICHEFKNNYRPQCDILVVPNGFDLDDFLGIGTEDSLLPIVKDSSEKRFTFLYAGNYNSYIDEYNPKNVIAAFDLFEKKYNISICDLVFVGTTDEETKQFIANYGNQHIYCFEQKPKHEALQMQAQADVLVHFHYPCVNSSRVTLKICEYAILHKPIISFNVKKGVLYEFLKKNQLGETADTYNIDESAELFYKAYTGQIKICENPVEKLNEFNYKNIGSIQAAAIKKLYHQPYSVNFSADD